MWLHLPRNTRAVYLSVLWMQEYRTTSEENRNQGRETRKKVRMGIEDESCWDADLKELNGHIRQVAKYVASNQRAELGPKN